MFSLLSRLCYFFFTPRIPLNGSDCPRDLGAVQQQEHQQDLKAAQNTALPQACRVTASGPHCRVSATTMLMHHGLRCSEEVPPHSALARWEDRKNQICPGVRKSPRPSLSPPERGRASLYPNPSCAPRNKGFTQITEAGGAVPKELCALVISSQKAGQPWGRGKGPGEGRQKLSLAPEVLQPPTAVFSLSPVPGRS